MRSAPRFFVVLVAVLAVTPLLPARAAESGLTVSADAVYTVVPDAGEVTAEVTVTVTNVTPNRVQGDRITRYYYDSLGLPVPAEADRVRAVSASGAALAVSLQPVEETDAVQIATVKFPSGLFYQSSTSFVLRFDLPGDPPRTAGGFRVNPAYAWFYVWAYGDPGASSVTIRLDRGFKVDLSGETVASRIDGNDQVLSAQGIQDPESWYVLVSARRDASLMEEQVPFTGGQVMLRAWPGDTEWAAEVTHTLQLGLPALEKVVGRPWPLDHIDVLEAYTPTLYGYAGWYLPDSGRIEIGEDLDTHVTLHEAAHTWFNASEFPERWINEGLADEFASRAAMEAGIDARSPTRIEPTADGSLPLNDWTTPVRFDDSEIDVQERYGYAASWWVTRQVVDEVGVDAMGEVVDGAFDDLIAYRGAESPETVAAADDWRRYLDLLQEVAGSTRAEDLFRRYVVTPDQADMLDRRDVSRTRYHALSDLAADWALPIAIRGPMGQWNFDAADRQMAIGEDVVAARDQVEQIAGSLEVAAPSLERRFEQADDLTPVRDAMNAELTSVEGLRGAETELSADRGIFERVGLLGADPTDEYRQAVAAFEASDLTQADRDTARVIAIFSSADRQGRDRVLIACGVAGPLVILGLFVLGRRRRRRLAARARLEVGPPPFEMVGRSTGESTSPGSGDG